MAAWLELLAGAKRAFISGKVASAWTTARTKKGSSVSLYPVSRSKRSFSRARQLHTSVTSISTIDQACGAVCRLSTMRSAMIRRAWVSGTNVPGIGCAYVEVRAAPGATGGGAVGAGASGGADAVAGGEATTVREAAKMSSAVTRPFAPLPLMVRMST